MKKFNTLVLSFVLFIFFGVTSAYASSVEVTTLSGLQTALEGDTDEIIIMNTLTISGDTLIDGNGKTVKAQVQGVNNDGLLQAGSTYVLFDVSSNVKLSIDDMVIKGGSTSAITSSGNLIITNSTISNSGSNSIAGGAINNKNGAKLILRNVSIYSNVASNAGGLLNEGTAIIDKCLFYNNKNIETGNFGGGAIENKSILILNNSIIANNYSREIGGGINNYGGTLYMLNSIVSGNITETANTKNGGGIGNNGGTMTMVNSIVANNYYINSSDNTEVSANDIGIANPMAGSTNMYYSLIGSSIINKTGATIVDATCTYASSNIFTSLEKGSFIDYTNTSREFNYDRPSLVLSGTTGNIFTKASGSAATGGAYTFLDYSDTDFTYALSYGTTATSTDATSITGTPTTLVDKYIDGTTRDSIVMGASDTRYILKGTAGDNGTIDGATANGKYYTKDSTVTIKATPNSGYDFAKWQIYENDAWTDYSEKSEITLTMTKNITIKAVFTETANPTTLDGIKNYIIIGAVSLIGLIGIVIYTRKKKETN